MIQPRIPSCTPPARRRRRRHGVVNGGAHATDRAMALELRHAPALAPLRNSSSSAASLSVKGTFMRERSSAHRIGDRSSTHRCSHKAAWPWRCSASRSPPAALLLEPLEHQAGDVDAVGGRRVVHRVVFGVGLVVEHGRWRRHALPTRSSRMMTMVRPAGPMFFCAPA
jgi:hypothetical protein